MNLRTPFVNFGFSSSRQGVAAIVAFLALGQAAAAQTAPSACEIELAYRIELHEAAIADRAAAIAARDAAVDACRVPVGGQATAAAAPPAAAIPAEEVAATREAMLSLEASLGALERSLGSLTGAGAR